MRRIRAAPSGSGNTMKKENGMKKKRKRVYTVLLITLCTLFLSCAGGEKGADRETAAVGERDPEEETNAGAEVPKYSELKSDGETVTSGRSVKVHR